MFIVPLQHITVAELLRGSLDVNCMCRIGKVQSPAIKSYSVIPLFRSSVILRFPVSPLNAHQENKQTKTQVQAVLHADLYT